MSGGKREKGETGIILATEAVAWRGETGGGASSPERIKVGR